MALLLYHVLCMFVVGHAMASVRGHGKLARFLPLSCAMKRASALNGVVVLHSASRGP